MEKWLEAQKFAEWAASRSSCTEVSDRQFGHSPYRLLHTVYFLVDPVSKPSMSN